MPEQRQSKMWLNQKHEKHSVTSTTATIERNACKTLTSQKKKRKTDSVPWHNIFVFHQQRKRCKRRHWKHITDWNETNGVCVHRLVLYFQKSRSICIGKWILTYTKCHECRLAPFSMFLHWIEFMSFDKRRIERRSEGFVSAVGKSVDWQNYTHKWKATLLRHVERYLCWTKKVKTWTEVIFQSPFCKYLTRSLDAFQAAYIAVSCCVWERSSQ